MINSSSEILNKTIKAKYNKKPFFRFAYYSLQFLFKYKVYKSFKSENSKSLIIHFHEFKPRVDHDYFLINLYKEISRNQKIDLLIYKRYFSNAFKNKFNSNLKKYFLMEQEIVSIFNSLKNKYTKIIIFCPHIPPAAFFSNLCLSQNILISFLQHGYYNFSNFENKYYSLASTGDAAFVFSEKDKLFFKNCKKIYICGDYLLLPKIKIEKLENNCTTFFVRYISNPINKDFNDIFNLLLKITTKKFSIRFHPKNSILIKLLFYFYVIYRKFSIIFRFTHNLGNKVFFIGTSAWKNYDYSDFNSFIFAESYAEALKYLQDTKKEYLLKESTKDYARLLFSIKNWLDS